MGLGDLFDTRKQLTFYGAYHNNPTNVQIHLFGVPLLLWSGLTLVNAMPQPEFMPSYQYKINNFLEFNLKPPTLWVVLCILYYTALEPIASLLYIPQMTLSLLSSAAFAHRKHAVAIALTIHLMSWVAQFLGHGLAEKRAPALLDNILGAFVLAPFFVHLELLFDLGYNPELHREIKNSVGAEIARIKKSEGDKKRAKAAKSQ